ncbi:pilus assembly protein [Rugamonas sp. DEMB1]|nr:pilus assembly protein [Rugamonas sp. DEMB1]
MEGHIGRRLRVNAPHSRSRRGLPQRRQGGIAAIEMAMVLPVLLILLTSLLYIGRVVWHYGVARNATQDAMRYFSTVPVADMASPAEVANVKAVVNSIIASETGELNPGDYAPSTSILCDGIICDGFTVPLTISIVIRIKVSDPFFDGITEASMTITTQAGSPYIGT